MAGARAGGVAVFLGAAIRLLRPQLTTHPRVGSAFVLTALFGAWFLPLNLFAVLVIAGTAGSIWLRPQ